MNEWETIDSAPRDGRRLLVFTNTGIMKVAWWAEKNDISGWIDCLVPKRFLKPTHYMELPKPPKQD